MTDDRRTSPELSAASERLLAALGNIASDLHAADIGRGQSPVTEAIAGLGERARSIVAELSRGSLRRRDAAQPRGAGPAPSADAAPDEPESSVREAGAESPELVRRLHELRACVAGIADVLEGTNERLGTIELQLGDPDASVERRLSESVERCEQVLAGIEYRIGRVPSAAQPAGGGDETPQVHAPAGAAAAARRHGPTVLVVAARSATRANCCIELEKLGFRTLAATDIARGLVAASREAPDAGLLVLDGPRDACTRMLEEWREREHAARLPRAAVLVAAGDALAAGDVRPYGFPPVRKEHGFAAVAASLLRLGTEEDDSDSGRC